MEFSKGEPSLQLNAVFTLDCVPGMLEGKGHQCIDMVFPFIL